MVGLITPPLLVALGLLLAGRSGPASFSVRCWPLGAAALALQLVLFNHPLDQQAWAIAWGPAIYLASMLVVTLVLLANGLRAAASNWPWLVAALGVALNIVVVSANGGYMPQSVDAREAAGGSKDRAQGRAAQLTNIRPLTEQSRLPFLADVIAEPAWFPMANVISVGDLLLSFGVAAAFLPRPAIRRRPPAALVGAAD